MTHLSITEAVPGDRRPEADWGQHMSPTTNTTTADQKLHRLRMVAADRASHAQLEALMMRLLSYDPATHNDQVCIVQRKPHEAGGADQNGGSARASHE